MTEGLWVPERPWSREGKLTSRTLLNRRRESSDRKSQRVREKSLGSTLRTSLWELEGEGEKNEVCGFYVCPTMVMYYFLKQDGGTNMSARLCRPRASVGVHVFGTVVFSWSFILLSLLTFLSFSLPLQSPLFRSFLLFPSSCGAGGRLQVLSNVRAMYYQWSTLQPWDFSDRIWLYNLGLKFMTASTSRVLGLQASVTMPVAQL